MGFHRHCGGPKRAEHEKRGQQAATSVAGVALALPRQRVKFNFTYIHSNCLTNASMPFQMRSLSAALMPLSLRWPTEPPMPSKSIR